MIISIYRYEDASGFGPFYNEFKHKYNWIFDGYKYGCLTLGDLNNYFKFSSYDLSRYNIVKYTINISTQTKEMLQYKKYLKGQVNDIFFKLENILRKEILNNGRSE